jgi:hypothetical protein
VEGQTGDRRRHRRHRSAGDQFHNTRFRVSTPEGAAQRIRYLLRHPEKIVEIGGKAREFVRDNFLLTRHLREYLTLILSLHYGAKDKIELRRNGRMKKRAFFKLEVKFYLCLADKKS